MKEVGDQSFSWCWPCSLLFFGCGAIQSGAGVCSSNGGNRFFWNAGMLVPLYLECNFFWSLIRIFKNVSVCVCVRGGEGEHVHTHACTVKRGEQTISGFKVGPKSLHYSQNFPTVSFCTGILWTLIWILQYEIYCYAVIFLVLFIYVHFILRCLSAHSPFSLPESG